MNKLSILLTLLTFAFSCGTNPPASSNQNLVKVEQTATPTTTITPTHSQSDSARKEKGHQHEHKAPRGGTLIAFGEEFAHLEIVLEEATGRITAYVLDGEAEKSIQIAQDEIEIEIEKPKNFSVKLTAVENALTGEKKGATSEFSTVNEELKSLKEFDADIKSIKIKGKEFKGEKFNFPKGNEH